jgi:hypothetical protein
MADNVTIGSVPWKTDDIGGFQVQYVKLMDGTDSSAVAVAYDASRGFQITGRRIKRIAVTPTITAGAYAAKDVVGGKMTFSAAARFSGAGGYVVGVTVIDKDQERAPLNLVLFDRDFTATADNAPFDPTDADLANTIGVVAIRNYSDLADNAVGYAECRLPFVCNTTDVVGQLVTPATPTYGTTSDLTVVLYVSQE